MADKPSYSIPGEYAFATTVPAAGASCATCIWVDRDGTRCTNKLYTSYKDSGGKPDLPKPANRWCCSLWTD